jgi:hypothetical protein
VNLGTPFLSLRPHYWRDVKKQAKLLRVLKSQVSLDRRNILAYQMGVRSFGGRARWTTNKPVRRASIATHDFLNFKSNDGLVDVARKLEPILEYIVRVLSLRGDSAAYDLLPFLRWIDSLGALSKQSRKRLARLEKSRDAGESPGFNLARFFPILEQFGEQLTPCRECGTRKTPTVDIKVRTPKSARPVPVAEFRCSVCGSLLQQI